MGWEAELIRVLQTASNGFLDGLMLILTQIGSEIFFFLVVAIVYWCVSKRVGYKFFNVYLLGTALNTLAKVVVKRPRPYDKYASTVASIGEKTGGYSFPSGHSHSISNISTQMVINFKPRRKLWIILGAVITVIVMFTRLYLGQHYLTDVIVGLAAGIIFAFILSYMFELLKDKEEYIAFVIAPLCIIILIVVTIMGGNSLDPNVLKVLGAYLAFSVGYFIEKRYIKFDPKSDKVWKNIVKVVIGLGVGLGIKEGLKFIFPQNIPVLYEFLRYFIIAAWASVGATALFKAIKL